MTKIYVLINGKHYVTCDPTVRITANRFTPFIFQNDEKEKELRNEIQKHKDNLKRIDKEIQLLQNEIDKI